MINVSKETAKKIELVNAKIEELENAKRKLSRKKIDKPERDRLNEEIWSWKMTKHILYGIG